MFILIAGEAENIMQFEGALLDMPMSLPTLSSIDLAREARQEELMIHSAKSNLLH